MQQQPSSSADEGNAFDEDADLARAKEQVEIGELLCEADIASVCSHRLRPDRPSTKRKGQMHSQSR